MPFHTFVPVAAVRGHVTKAWHTREPELHGFNAVKADAFLYLLDDGRVVRQDWYHGHERPTRHYVVFAPRGRKVSPEQWIADRVPESYWAPMPSFDVVGGR